MLRKLISSFHKQKAIKKTRENNLVSVIIPSYNYARYLDTTINSVLNQSYKNIELIIIDDASSDDSVSVIKQFKKKFPKKIKAIFNKKNQGLIKVYKKAFSLAKGEYVAFLDADDMMAKDNLLYKVSVLDEFNEIGLVYSRTIKFSLSTHKFRASKFDAKALLFNKNTYFFYRNNIMSFSLIVVRKELLKKIRFDLPKKFLPSTDWWFYAQLSLLTRFAKVQKELVAKRKHENNYSTEYINFLNKQVNGFKKYDREFRELLRHKVLGIGKIHHTALMAANKTKRKIKEAGYFLIKKEL